MRGSGFRLRVADLADAERVAAIYAPIVRETAISFEIDPPDATEMRRRIAAILPTHPWLVAEDDAGVAGYAYASAHRTRAAYGWSTETTVYLAESARRHGVGSALYSALLALTERLGFHRAFAGITLPNPASAALHESLGFVFLGRFAEVGFKQGAWHDVGWWERPLAARGDPAPEPPAPFAVWRGSAAGRRDLAELGVDTTRT